MLVETQRSAGPVYGRAADGLDDPGRQRREVLGNLPASGCRARVLPGELGEAVPLVVDEVLVLDARAGFQDHDLDALLRELVAERAAAGAGTHDHHHAA